jgi:hypothetical protein
MLTNFRDVTEIKEAEQELIKSEKSVSRLW